MAAEVFESFHKVRPFECDYYGHVNNAIYLNYLEFARMEVLEKKGFTLTGLKNRGLLLVIRRIDITYRWPALAHDQLLIRTVLKEHRRVGATFHQEILRQPDEKLLAEAEVTWVVVNSAGRPVAVPPEMRRALGMDEEEKRKT